MCIKRCTKLHEKQPNNITTRNEFKVENVLKQKKKNRPNGTLIEQVSTLQVGK